MEKPNGYDELQLDTQYQEYLKSEKWKRIAYERMKIDNFVCQGCGSRGSSTNPLQVHHFRYQGVIYQEDKGDNLYTQLVTLCACCHKVLGNAMERVTNCNGRRGWKHNSTVPKVNIYTLSGQEIALREENRK